MSQHFPPASPKEVARVIKRLGFRLIRQSGSHAVYKHPDDRWVSLPMHSGDLGRGLLRKIIRDLELSVEQFNQWFGL